MTRISRGGGLCALLLLAAVTVSAAGPLPDAAMLTARTADGRLLGQVPIAAGQGWCVLWSHSVRGFEVSDCYENRAGRMVLVRAHLPDFAAGLDHIPGRGRQVSDGRGGYWIEDINEAVPGNSYVLRPGAGPVNHRIKAGDTVIALSALAPRARVTLALTPLAEVPLSDTPRSARTEDK